MGNVIIGTDGRNRNHNITIMGVTAFKLLTSIEYRTKNTHVEFEVIDDSYFMYEKGYRKRYTRKVKFKDGNATFRFDSFVYDITSTFDFSDELNHKK